MGERFPALANYYRVASAAGVILSRTLVRPDLADVYARYIGSVLAWAASIGGPAVDPEEIAHEVFITAQRKMTDFDSEKGVEVWLFTLTRNAARTRRQTERLRNVWRGLWRATQPVEDPRPLAPELLEQAEARRRVHAALDSLNQRYREVLVLFELEGRSGADVATLMGVKERNVWLLLHRARAALARAMEAMP